MRKTRIQKLSLAKETLIQLERSGLARAAGGLSGRDSCGCQISAEYTGNCVTYPCP
ncbi:MAG TPA: hypothetical protein VHU81_16895 [Thermoanaerobaculia bacterium]|jgi:hypothetical protein|nr:hypothetical protein [Thermoanaerobaculia bacterium]